MSWFFLALICMLGWGTADLFYKQSSETEDRYSHLKIAVWVGIVMGVCAFALMPLSESRLSLGTLPKAAVQYAPASLSYILSMVIGYAGLRYLELSIVSPVQNSSGALSTLCMAVYFVLIGRGEEIREEFSSLDITGTALILIGLVALAIVEQRLEGAQGPRIEDRGYRFGALALLFPILYCVFDTIGTAADGIILDGESGMGLGEIDVLILYGLTFFLVGLGCWIYLWIKEKRPYHPFRRSEGTKALAACCEEFGQVFYVYAMAKNPLDAAPMIASYCIVSLLLSVGILKEKLEFSQYACVAAVIAGVMLLGVSEGLAG